MTALGANLDVEIAVICSALQGDMIRRACLGDEDFFSHQRGCLQGLPC